MTKKKNYGQMKRFTVTEAQATLLLRMMAHCRKDKAFADTNANLWRALERNVRNAEAVNTTANAAATAQAGALNPAAGFDEPDGNGHQRTHFVTCDNCEAHKDSEAFTRPCPGPMPSPPRDPHEASIAAQRTGKD